MTPLVQMVASGSNAAKCLVSAVSATPAMRVVGRHLKPPAVAVRQRRCLCLITADLGHVMLGYGRARRGV